MRLALLLALATPILAQTSTEPTIHTNADLDQREAKLLAKATSNPTGLAFEVMDDYGNDRTFLVVRVHTGEPERHQFWADEIVVRKGTITLVTGGAMQAEHPNGTSPGETLASSIEGGKEVVLHPGDIAHVPANVPHWVKIAPGTTTTYLIYKEK